ncbi:MAG: hypothetical protein ACR2KG_05110 [Nocardioidaceae bacterium]
MSLELARTVADAVLYEGYLLYPYRATSKKNQARWQFGVLGPPGAAAAGLGEESGMEAQCLLRACGPGESVSARALSGSGASGAVGGEPAVTVHLRFLQLQVRDLERVEPDDPAGYVPVDELVVEGERLLSWDEAVERECVFPSYQLFDLHAGVSAPVEMPGGDDIEPLSAADGTPVGRIVRRRWPLDAQITVTATDVDGFVRLSIDVENTRAEPPRDKDDAIRTSLIGAHLIISAHDTEFISLLEPPDSAAQAAASCQQRRCWPVLAGSPSDTDAVLASPIILYDYPEVAAESAGALFDSTEIDEILTLRVMTLTDEEKAEARATDPRARDIIDRCDEMSAETLQQLHGILRDPHAGAAALAAADDLMPTGLGVPPDLRNAEGPSFDTGDAPWWDPAADASVQPEVDAVVINGVSVSKGSLVRVHPSRRADAQDLFFADEVARVTAVLSDVDGDVHVAVLLVDDPAADMHDWYGRYLYFAPEELEPLSTEVETDHREESRS